MTYEWTLYFCLFLALWSAIIGGVFSAFSEFVMSGLRKTEPAGGIEAMQHINRDVIKTQFVAGILSIAAMSGAFALYSLFVFDGAALAALAAVLAGQTRLPISLCVGAQGLSIVRSWLGQFSEYQVTDRAIREFIGQLGSSNDRSPRLSLTRGALVRRDHAVCYLPAD